MRNFCSNSNNKIVIIIGIITILSSITLMFIRFEITIGTLFFTIIGVLILIWGALKKISGVQKYKIVARKIQKIYIILVSIWLISFIIIQIFVFSSVNDTTNKQIDFAVVLGSGLQDGKPSDMLSSRLLKAVEYTQNNQNTIVIVSGGIGREQKISEAEIMKGFLIDKGVKSENIKIEDKATNTMENIMFSKEIMKSIDDNSGEILIITSEFHLFRAKLLAKRNGLTPHGMAATTPITIRTNYFIREYFAVIKSVLFDY